MKIDSRELDQVAAAGQPRHDIYTPIHKALRACMADALLALGRMDPADELEVADATERVMHLLDLCAAHLQHENEFLHTAIEARSPGASAALAGDHEEHERELAHLAAAVAAVRAASPAQRAVPAAGLYRELALFIAGNFQHMHREETEHNAVLWACYSDAELAAIHEALVASIGPAEMLETMRWLVPAIHHQERVGLLSEARAKAPAPAFAAIVDAGRPHLRAGEWTKLASALALGG